MFCCFSKPTENSYSELEIGSGGGDAESITTGQQTNDTREEKSCCATVFCCLCTYVTRKNARNYSKGEIGESSGRTLLEDENRGHSVVVRAYDCNDNTKRKYAMAFMAVE